MDNIREEVKELQIGQKVRRIRQERRMTLQDLANATGLSKPLLSQIENEQVIPPLATLLRIAKAFKINLHSFFEDEGRAEKCTLVRAGESRPVRHRSSPTNPEPPYHYFSLSYGKRHRSMEPFIIEFETHQWHKGLETRHEGEEFLYLLEGELEFHYADEVLHLRPGDSLYYDSSEPHGYVCASETPSRAIAVFYSRD